MRITSLVFGILVISIMPVALIPCLGWLNWLNVSLAIIGLVIGILAYNEKDDLPKENVIIGIVLCSIAIFFGIFRLILGKGVL